MKTTTLLGAALLTTMLAGTAMAQPAMKNDDHAVSRNAAATQPANASGKMGDAQEFATKAAISGKFEIESSKVAVANTENAQVKAFAQKMIDDHMKAAEGLKMAIKDGGLNPALADTPLDEKHAKKVTDLREHAGKKDFDEEYMDAQETAHDDTIKLFKDYAEDGDNAALKTFAGKTLPTLEMHGEHANDLEKTVATFR